MFYKELTEAELRREYWAERRALAGAAGLAQHVSSPGGRRKVARMIDGPNRRFELICAVARKRGVDLLAGPVAE
jgi:hypothetical protein